MSDEDGIRRTVASYSQLATGSTSYAVWDAYPPPGKTIMCVAGDSGCAVI